MLTNFWERIGYPQFGCVRSGSTWKMVVGYELESWRIILVLGLSGAPMWYTTHKCRLVENYRSGRAVFNRHTRLGGRMTLGSNFGMIYSVEKDPSRKLSRNIFLLWGTGGFSGGSYDTLQWLLSMECQFLLSDPKLGSWQAFFSLLYAIWIRADM